MLVETSPLKHLPTKGNASLTTSIKPPTLQKTNLCKQRRLRGPTSFHSLAPKAGKSWGGMTEVQLWFCRELQPGRELPPAARATFHSLTTRKLTLRILITTFKILSALITIYNNTDNLGFLIFQACTVTALPCQQHRHQKTKSNNLKIRAVKLLLIYVVFTSQKPN